MARVYLELPPAFGTSYNTWFDPTPYHREFIVRFDGEPAHFRVLKDETKAELKKFWKRGGCFKERVIIDDNRIVVEIHDIAGIKTMMWDPKCPFAVSYVRKRSKHIRESLLKELAHG